ncbi:hypothetical protein CBR_g61506 [Chara braunii]|uniref:Protein kinase domain-containing protein n=1 Tax=Chara braunii TaxID=69332 RepID=A0A388K948_CHABU|nr:hypothetical protein CBR_g61506 [Chara braunii]|eukprot:GBG66463.1 hypothetical protein CBR_g61506 [Chara braunii]
MNAREIWRRPLDGLYKDLTSGTVGSGRERSSGRCTHTVKGSVLAMGVRRVKGGATDCRVRRRGPRRDVAGSRYHFKTDSLPNQIITTFGATSCLLSSPCSSLPGLVGDTEARGRQIRRRRRSLLEIPTEPCTWIAGMSKTWERRSLFSGSLPKLTKTRAAFARSPSFWDRMGGGINDRPAATFVAARHHCLVARGRRSNHAPGVEWLERSSWSPVSGTGRNPAVVGVELSAARRGKRGVHVHDQSRGDRPRRRHVSSQAMSWPGGEDFLSSLRDIGTSAEHISSSSSLLGDDVARGLVVGQRLRDATELLCQFEHGMRLTTDRGLEVLGNGIKESIDLLACEGASLRRSLVAALDDVNDNGLIHMPAYAMPDLAAGPPSTSLAVAPVATAAAAVVSFSAASSSSSPSSSSSSSRLRLGGGGGGGEEIVEKGRRLPYSYDPEAIAAYFRGYPQKVILRATYIALRGAKLGLHLLLDWQRGQLAEMEKERARELQLLITQLGPTAIKIGQALSIRPDLLPVGYLEELQKLQDRVPPFSSEQARAIIQESLGQPASEIFSELTEEPVAAASLGQVYKGRLRKNGDLVALKVQRPGVLEDISLDLFLLRNFAKIAKFVLRLNSDTVALLDTWATRFFDELDYVREAANAMRFAEDMKSLPHIIVADVYLEYTSRKVLTTKWIDGEKLSESSADDVGSLVDSMLYCYLTQLLETGFLHADPHPGNLLRTPEGNLCVLDFGLMTEVTEDQRYTLIEYVSHLLNSDYEKVAEDLVRLGFIPDRIDDPEEAAKIAPALSRVFGQLVQGGGFANVNVAKLTSDLAKMSEDYVFVIPPYFAMILRAFGVLEGIGLDADPNYAIVNGCYPYISKRLLIDDSPRVRGALQYFLYAGKDHINVDRLENLAGGLQSFRTLMDSAPKATTAAAEGGGVDSALSRQRRGSSGVDPVAREALMLVFAREGSFIQELLLKELTRTIDVLSREACAELWRMATTRLLRLPLPLPLPWSLSGRGASWPLPLPGVAMGAVMMASLTEEDRRSIDTARRIWAVVEPQLWSLVEPQLMQPVNARGVAEAAQDIVPLLYELLPGFSVTVQRFTIMLLQRLTLRLADDLDGQNSIAEWERLYSLSPPSKPAAPSI